MLSRNVFEIKFFNTARRTPRANLATTYRRHVPPKFQNMINFNLDLDVKLTFLQECYVQKSTHPSLSLLALSYVLRGTYGVRL